MSKAILGPTIDLHTGGVDLLFPHHENEIAQSECCNGTTFARHWYHSEHLLVDGKKMSKSLGNLYTLDDLVGKHGSDEMAVRYALLAGHPRKQLNFTLDSLHSAESALGKIESFYDKIEGVFSKSLPDAPSGRFASVLDALRDDLNTPSALGALFTAMRELDSNFSSACRADFDSFKQALFALGFSFSGIMHPVAPVSIRLLAEKRWAAKQAKDFAAADALRKELTAAGWSMLDRKDGYSLEPVKK